MKKLVVSALALAVASWAAPSSAATLKALGCFAKSHDYIEAFFDTFIKPLNDAKGPIKINYLGGPEVTPSQKAAPALQRGVVDVLLCPAAYYGGLFGEARLPGVQNQSLEEIRKNGGFDMMQEAWGKKLNARIIAWTHFGGQKFYMYTSFKPKLSKEVGVDLKGLKIRSTGLYNPFLKAMGATTVVIAPPDVYSALERGVVAGLAWPWGSVAKYGWEKFLKYRIKPDFFGASVLVLINKDKYNSLSSAEKDQLEKQARIYEQKSPQIMIDKGVEDDAKLAKAGVQDIELEGEYARAYIRTIYEAKWAENDKLKYTVDYKQLKSKLFVPTK
jgi:TRAP-type C4-dicarboxylate transport system substrate-binding protein